MTELLVRDGQLARGGDRSSWSPRARALALYLPQFHPIPENDAWWGPGFTEWTNVARAKPLFRGHHQPNLPGDLGFYDLRLPEAREAQADLARRAGIEGFVYWHYWFAGRRLLERPLAEVLASREPDFPFCVAWANQSWTGHWYGSPKKTLVEQTYPGVRDYQEHFAALLPLLCDDRYICVDGKPLLTIFMPAEVPDGRILVETWRDCAERAGLPGLHLIGFDQTGEWDPRDDGYDGAIALRFLQALYDYRGTDPITLARRKLEWLGLTRASSAIASVVKKPQAVVPYEAAIKTLIPPHRPPYEAYPCVVPNWDNTPRSGSRGSVLQGSTPELFAKHLEHGIRFAENNDESHRLLFVKSWNEWAEGNYLEPDQRWGTAYLDAFRRVIAPVQS